MSLTAQERKSIISLSAILSLRMLGLFMILPVFSLYALQLAGSTPALVGVAAGIYGLFQAIFQISFGALSDRYGRKPIILVGLVIFIVGSLLAAYANNIWIMIIGRSLQGVGAIGGTILATLADLTREEQRTKAMMVAGITIGGSFSLAMLVGPLIATWLPVNHLFLIGAGCAVVAIILLFTTVPTPLYSHWHRDTEPEYASFRALLKQVELTKLNVGIFLLHAIFTASFIVIPITLSTDVGLTSRQQWMIYLPTLLIGATVALSCMRQAEEQQQVKKYFLLSIAALIAAELLLVCTLYHPLFSILGLCLFFGGFSILESFLPSLVSRTAPAAHKGSALGIYSCSQFLGIFVGGVLGGWIYGHSNVTTVYFFCSTLAVFWFALAYFMHPPRHLTTLMIKIPFAYKSWEIIAADLKCIPGIVEISYVTEESTAYLKMEKMAQQNPDFLRLQEQLQCE